MTYEQLAQIILNNMTDEQRQQSVYISVFDTEVEIKEVYCNSYGELSLVYDDPEPLDDLYEESSYNV